VLILSIDGSTCNVLYDYIDNSGFGSSNNELINMWEVLGFVNDKIS